MRSDFLHRITPGFQSTLEPMALPSTGYNITVTDLFAGAGGSSTGMVSIPGVHVVIAANHWQVSVDIHNANHPNTDHATVDLHQEDPRYFPKTDVLWASPECTKWSQANSRPQPAIDEGLFEDPLSEDAATRSRLLMFDVLRFAEHHRYRAMVIENVIDIATQAKYRTAWDVWRRQLRGLGYKFRVVSLNSMHAQAYGLPAPQSRDRIYIVCWREGERAPDVDRILRPKAWCPKCEAIIESNQSWKNGREVGRYRQTYLYVHGACGTVVEPAWLPASHAIDWSLPGEPIGNRLKPKTRLRIAMGIARYWGPIHIEAQGNQYDAADPKHAQHAQLDAYYRAWSTSDVMRTLHTQETKALAIPVEGRDGKEALPLDMPMRTQTTRLETALAHQPFISEMRGGGSVGRPTTEPLSTVSAGGNHHALIASYYSRNDATRPADRPMGTVTTEPRHALVQPDDGALISRMNSGGASMTTPASEEMRTLTGAGHQALLTGGKLAERRQVTERDLKLAQEMLPSVLFRMLTPSEVAKGMAFPDDYKWDVPDVKGRKPSKRELTKAAGNAVTPPAARDLIATVVEAITGEAA